MGITRWLETINDRRPWVRTKEDWLTKTREMNDGEVQHMLLEQGPPITEDMRDAIYGELIQLRSSLSKAVGLWVAAFSLAFLSIYGVVESANFGGVAISRNGFLPVALIGTALTSLWFATIFAKFSLLRTWFEQQAKLAKPPRKAWLYLRYPEAFQYFTFSRANIGYPKDLFPVGSDMGQLLPLALVMLIAVAWAIGTIAMQVILMIEVWHTAYPTTLVARLIVAVAIILNVLALIAPRPSIIRRRYVHYGLTQLLGRADEQRAARAKRRFASIRERRWPEGE
ncbi:hypothetical protein [Sphingomonas sp.]|uniref:hypothetical protein n=1 Tax=Sphingomonas sp. TaxID=28214 RepID=UPI0025CDB611|nr:hypothetical protein [Sphingomonas sp.]